MAKRISLNNPVEGHYPDVGRTQIGMTPTSPSRPRYGTTLRCSCGWRAGESTKWRSPDGSTRQGRPDSKVSNEAPSRGGRTAANLAYQEHVAPIGVQLKVMS